MHTKKILVTGGAGYIGSHMVDYVKRTGYVPVILDNLSSGHRDVCDGVEFIVGDVTDAGLLACLFAKHDFAAVMHFASLIQVGESVLEPARYYQNNVAGTLALLHAMLVADVKYFIFSSSAAVYGEPQFSPIDETHLIAPVNPYGHTKAMVEQVLNDYAQSYGLHFSALRYFNAAGADVAANLGERHEPETHLIPLVLQVAAGLKKSITIFGDDYPTEDGTCVRDYIHVMDICHAHWLALQRLWNGGSNAVFNLGTGYGYSVQQVIDTAIVVTAKNIPTIKGSRRAGDPAVLVADASYAATILNWKPKYSDLKTIIEHAWQSMRRTQKHPHEEAALAE